VPPTVQVMAEPFDFAQDRLPWLPGRGGMVPEMLSALRMMSFKGRLSVVGYGLWVVGFEL